ncbi:AraC family transcriptional regulator [Leptolyngbya sp. GGD]|uniref:AraC family transcriptional regulator n=1 Tax=Leptolyngbya sp. GGD TaxID=2997907 RepID=UPI00227D394F|nr:AraC family transcriptional regulator [Leptolyngbya sp. GGD]MCY6494293.1 AraC family transcriptional regulator [Leptolyngbya sp. GGD]
MRSSEPSIQQIDFSSQQTSDFLLPHPAVLKSCGWEQIHFEHHHQPQFETPEHQGNWHVIAYCPLIETIPLALRSGERWLDGQLKREARNTGDIAMIPSGIAQRCNWSIAAEFTIVALDPALLQHIGQDWVNPDRIELIPAFMTQQDALIQGIVSTLRAEVEGNKFGGQLLVDSLRTTLAIHLLRNYCTTQPKSSGDTDGLSKLKLRQVTEYIQENLHHDLKLIELATIAQMSPYHFLRLFKQTLNITPHQYILQCRIEKASILLRQTDLSIALIATQVGFCDQSHLTRCFKRVLGVTPKQVQQV